MSCLEQITELRQQHDKTLELYKELYDSYIAPNYKSCNSSILDVTSGQNHRTVLTDTGSPDVTCMVRDDSQQTINSTCDIPRLESQNTTISEMWKNFSIDQYAPHERKKSNVRAMTAPPIKKSKPRTQRITIPEPFYMTLREELKRPTKTKAQEEAELKKIQQEIEEETECRKQFKASPIPPSTFERRLKHLEDQQEVRRQEVKEQRIALTKAIQKPFSFDKRFNLQRSRSLSALDTDVDKKDSKHMKFHARPMPHHIFDPEVDEQAREEEAYRQIRIKMRAEQLLADSQLPDNMRRYALHYTDGRIRKQIQDEKEQRAHLTEDHTFNPVIKDYIPDYSLLHKQQEEAILQRQSTKPTTVMEPFHLHTEQLAQVRALNPRSPVTMVTTPEPVKSRVRSPCLYTGVYSEAITSKPTISSNLRDSATRQKLLQEKRIAQAGYEKDLTAKVRQLEIRKSISEKSKALDPTVPNKMATQRKLKEKLESQKKKELEYKEKLEEMKIKLKNRPFLFERVSMDTARLTADKAFRKALVDAGVNDSLIDDISNYEQDSLMPY